MTNSVQIGYEAAAIMRRAWGLLEIEKNEFQIACLPPRNEILMERARAAMHVHLDSWLDASASITESMKGR
jgi:hypothetical protein